MPGERFDHHGKNVQRHGETCLRPDVLSMIEWGVRPGYLSNLEDRVFLDNGHFSLRAASRHVLQRHPESISELFLV
jgi:hypothetical protein